MSAVNDNENYISANCSFNSDSGHCNYPFKCQECDSLAMIKDFDFKNNKYNIICNNGHSFDFDSYEKLINKKTTIKNNKFSCDDLKEELNKDNNKINDENSDENSDENTDESSTKESTNYKDDENEQLQEIYKYIDKIIKSLNDWKKDMNKKIDNYVRTIDNYYKTHKILLCYYKNNTKDFENNNILKSNHKLFQDNIMKVNEYLVKADQEINNIKKDDFEVKSSCFSDILKDFDSTNIFSLKSIVEEKTEPILEKNINKKIADMDKMKIPLSSETKCFCPFHKEQYLLFGLKTGEIYMYKQTNNSHFSFILSMKAFGEQVEHICELDEDLIAATDGKNKIKIIQLTDNFSSYKIVQSLGLKEDSEYIYSMIYLPLLSKSKNNHYFCTGDEKHILIFKSNSKPKYLDDDKNVDNTDIKFELIKDIKVNTLVHCLVEANEKYIVAACTKDNTLKIFDMTKDFKILEDIKGFELSKGSNILSLVPNKNILIVACADGFYLIDTNKRKIYKRIHCKYSVLTLDMISENTLVCCTSARNDNRIKQYALEGKSFNFEKISERRIHKNYDIWKLKKFNQEIFFLDNSAKVNYLL